MKEKELVHKVKVKDTILVEATTTARLAGTESLMKGDGFRPVVLKTGLLWQERVDVLWLSLCLHHTSSTRPGFT